jgi:hypothetical protein
MLWKSLKKFILIKEIVDSFYTPLVVLFSTSYRTWDNELVLVPQINLINRIAEIYKCKLNLSVDSEPIIGIHYWDEELSGEHFSHLNGIKRVSPLNPPVDIMKFNFLHERSKQMKISGHNFIYGIQSTKKALSMADNLHHKLYGCPIPDNQLIFRLRPDIIIKYDSTDILENCDLNSLFYLSNTNTNDRPYISENSPEIGDAMSFTTKKTLNKLFSISYKNYPSIFEYFRKEAGRIVSFNEQYLFNLLDYAGINVIQDKNILMKLLRTNGYTYCSGYF